MKNQLLRGTMILTVAGIVTRLIGFIYRIFLADKLGETNLGIYQLIFPVYSICFTIYAAGIQTAVSQKISHQRQTEHAGTMKSAMILSLCFSISLSVLLFWQRNQIAHSFLGTNETAPLLAVLSLIFPFCGITSIINGYFYGINHAKIPAMTQIVEQVVRVVFVIGVCWFMKDAVLAMYIAVGGLILGELFSNFYNLYWLQKNISISTLIHSHTRVKSIFSLSLPLSGTKLIIALLGSVESVMIPSILQKYGYTQQAALGLYGILSGVVLPFILFPGTITNSLSVLLLPAISRASGTGSKAQVRYTSSITVRYSLLLGVLTGSVFLNYGREIGMLLFRNESAGKLLVTMAFLCPFLYVTTTLGSIINGLGKTGITFFFTILGLVIRILCLLFLTPHYGIYGYVGGMLLSQIVICLLNGTYVIRKSHVSYNLSKYFIWPMIFSCCLMYISKIAGNWLAKTTGIAVLKIVTILPATFVFICYLLFFQLISVRDFRLRKY